jgi:tetratricopeptide (TPR) repeat protein
LTVDQITLFADKLEKLKDTWRSIEIKVLASKVENRWINLGTIIKLSLEEKEAEERELFQLPDCIKVLQQVKKFNLADFRTMLSGLNKSIKVKDLEIVSESLGDFYHLTKEKENWTENGITDTEGWPAYLLRCYGKHPRELLKENIDKIDEALRANIEPFVDIADLSANYIFTVGGAHVTAIYVIAPIYVKLEGLALSTAGELRLGLRCHKSIDIKNLRMNVILSSASANVERFQLSFGDKARIEGDFLVIDQVVKKDLVSIKGARTYLFYGDEMLRADWISAFKPSSEEELRKDILNVAQRIGEAFLNISTVLDEIDLAINNGIINIEDNVKDKSVWNDLGIYCMENGLYRQAEFVYGRMIDTITRYERDRGKRIHKGLAFCNLASALLCQVRTEEAKKMFEQAYEEDKLTYGVIEAEKLPARDTLRKFFKQ